jgi:hypothetical protein
MAYLDAHLYEIEYIDPEIRGTKDVMLMLPIVVAVFR